MAINFSEKQLDFARKKFYGNFYTVGKKLNFLNKLTNIILIILFNIKILFINQKRKFFKTISLNKKKNNIPPLFDFNFDESQLNDFKKILLERRYLFIENFLNNDYYLHLLNEWPNINFFEQNKKIIKHYSIGFKCSFKSNKNLENFNYLNDLIAIADFYKNICSTKFDSFIKKLKPNEEFKVYSISATMVGNNSYLIPHMDGIYNKNSGDTLNFIYFLDGNDDNIEYSGGTGIYQDNNFQSPILLPKTLKNSVLIYLQSEKFYHGFKLTKMPKGIFRKTVNIQFFSSHLFKS